MSEERMHVLKTFLAGAFLGAGAFGALTHAAWTSTVHMSSIIPALSVADVIEAGGATFTGIIALLVVAKQDGQNSASSH